MNKIFQMILLFAGNIFGLYSLAQGQDELKPIKEIFEPAGTFPANQYVKVAVLQWAPPIPARINISSEEAESFKQGNRVYLEAFVRQAVAAGAKLVVLPEFAAVGYPDIPELPDDDDNFRSREEVAPYVELIPGPTTTFFGALAKELNIKIHIGLVEADKKTNLYYDSVVAIGEKGQVLASYRKNHLFELEYNFLAAGAGPGYYDSDIGRVGLLACSDVYNRSLLNSYRNLGVSLLALSTSWTQQNTGWDHFTAAARQTRSALAASNHTYFPDSGLINADGSTQAHIRQSSGLAFGYLKKK